MSDPLYKKDLLRLAANATGAGRLTAPNGTGSAHNPACGDKITVDISVEASRITAIAHDTKACVLTQASASILGREVSGLSPDEVVALHSQVKSMLEGGDPPLAPFDVYTVFGGVADHRNRHKCVLLPIEAILAALEASDPAKESR
jgi:nitrogen fixation NifU-like protein